MVVVAPDSFKGTIAAADVARAIADGLRKGGMEAVELPIGDGGEGTMGALVAALGGELRTARVSDPLGRPLKARFALLPDGRAVVETAEASGLQRVAEEDRDAWAASTYGTGELIVAAVEAGASEVLVTVGGSATTDGGAGALAALDEAGVQPKLEVLCDVRTPFEGAPRVFGPQKGADAAHGEAARAPPGQARGCRPARSARHPDDRGRGRAVGWSLGVPARAPGARRVLRARHARLRRADARLPLRGHRRGPPRRADAGRQGGR